MPALFEYNFMLFGWFCKNLEIFFESNGKNIIRGKLRLIDTFNCTHQTDEPLIYLLLHDQQLVLDNLC